MFKRFPQPTQFSVITPPLPISRLQKRRTSVCFLREIRVSLASPRQLFCSTFWFVIRLWMLNKDSVSRKSNTLLCKSCNRCDCGLRRYLNRQAFACDLGKSHRVLTRVNSVQVLSRGFIPRTCILRFEQRIWLAKMNILRSCLNCALWRSPTLLADAMQENSKNGNAGGTTYLLCWCLV